MKALVTGGGGFLGRYIVMKLLARGDSVRVLGRQAYSDLEVRGVETIRADLQNATAVEQACHGMDTVFHAGAQTAYWGPWRSFHGTNVVGDAKCSRRMPEGRCAQTDLYQHAERRVGSRRP
jgi:nucleoside-diphosphate-sugar epimerase